MQITNTTNPLGREVKQRLEACGCVVYTVPSAAHTDVSSTQLNVTSPQPDVISTQLDVTSTLIDAATRVDALLVIGAQTRPGLDGISELVSADVYDNLKVSIAFFVNGIGTYSLTSYYLNARLTLIRTLNLIFPY